MRVLLPLLLLSLLANVYLLVRGDDPEVVQRDSPRPARAPSLSRFQALDRAALEQRVVTAEADVARYLPVEEKYERRSRSPEVEAQIRPYLDRVFEGPTYTVECHGLICKLQPNEDNSDWMNLLQTNPGRYVLFRSILFADGTWLEVNDVGEQLISTILSAATPKLRACGQEHSPRGELTYQLVMTAGRITIELTGSLADHLYGACARRAFDDAIALVPVPAGTAIKHEPQTLTLPR